MILPDPIKNFVEKVSKLPSIGPRQATRLAFYIINLGKTDIKEIVKSLEGLEKMAICDNCFFIFAPGASSGALAKEDKLCEICQDQKRNQGLIAIVEKETDLVSLENTKKYNGRYLIIGGLSKNGVLNSEQKNRLNKLKDFIKNKLNGIAEEIIIATNPTTYGDFNAIVVAKELDGFAKKITRLGRGIPTGGEIEFADEETLGSALERRI